MDGMVRIIIEGSDDRLVELLEVVTRQGARPAATPEPEGMLDPVAVAAWLADQFADPSLEAAMMEGSLDSSPVAALGAELIRRVHE